jgi:hypothetical protein
MAGNVREWCWTPVQKFRYALGGGWDDPAYQLSFPNAHDPFTRGGMNGFRCAKYPSPLPAALAGEVAFVNRDRRRDLPADDDAYRLFRSLHSYDRTELKTSVEYTDETSPYWRREKVSFQAAYVGERVIAHLFLPTSCHCSTCWAPRGRTRSTFSTTARTTSSRGAISPGTCWTGWTATRVLSTFGADSRYIFVAFQNFGGIASNGSRPVRLMASSASRCADSRTSASFTVRTRRASIRISPFTMTVSTSLPFA